MAVWFDENYLYRQPVTVDFSGVTGSPTTKDVRITVPDDWDLFWDTIRSDFLDVVLTNEEGVVLDFQRTGANYSNRELKLEVNDMDVAEDNIIQQIFLFYGYSSEATDRSTTFTAATPETGYIYLGAPLLRIVEGYGLVPTSNQPVQTFVKQTAEQIDIYFSIQGLLAPRTTETNGRLLFEEISFVEVKSLDSSGTNAIERYSLTDTRFLQGYVRVRAKGGSDDTNYALALIINTTQSQIYDIRCLIKVKDLLPS
jgi:hypothetical protein